MNEDYEILYTLIRKYEGLRLISYLCPAGVWTCGYGSTGPDVVKGVVWTRDYAENRMRADASIFIKGVLKLEPILADPKNRYRLCACASFSYNLGLTRFAGSTMRKLIHNGHWAEAATECKKWTRGGGKILPGLVLRRNEEAGLLLRMS